jgi:hypothetical protein
MASDTQHDRARNVAHHCHEAVVHIRKAEEQYAYMLADLPDEVAHELQDRAVVSFSYACGRIGQCRQLATAALLAGKSDV